MAGEGIEGGIDGLNVAVGGIHFLRPKLTSIATSSFELMQKAVAVIVVLALGGEMAGEIVLADELHGGTQVLCKLL